jgi:hypothetical protein
MLAPAMRPRIALTAALALALIVLAGALSACGSSDDESEAVEGEPIEIAGLEYNVQITRFLNPDDTEDTEYLVGQPPLEPETEYLGVFMVIENQTGDARPSADDYTVVDTLDQEFKPAESESPYALDIGAEVPADGQLPIPDTTAATGPNQGSLVIFPVSGDVSENRPLTLEIHTFDGDGEIRLDI